MAKYRITSIPQSLPKNQFGGLFKNKRKKIVGTGFPRRNKSSQNSEYEEEEQVPAQSIPIENLSSSSALSAFIPNEPIVEQPDLYNVDPIYNNPKEKTRNSEVDRLFNKIVLPEEDNSKSCPQGYVMYKGECVDTLTLLKIYGKESDYYYDSQLKELQDLEAKKKSDRESRVQEEQRKQKEYTDKIFKLKKSDKIEPFASYTFEDFDMLVPVLDENKQPIIDEETGKPKTQKLVDFAKQNYLVIKNDTDNSIGKKGTYSIFPSDIVVDRIINHGFQPLQFNTLWGFNKDQVKQVEEQFGDVMVSAKTMYDKTMSEKILNEMEKTGKSPDEIISGFSKKLGKPTYLSEPIQNYVNTVVENYTKAVQNETNKTEIEKYKGFDFLNATRQVWVDKETGKETKKGAENAVLAGETFDPEKYYNYWVNQGKTEKEKAERRKKINDIKNKKYNNVLEGTVGDLYREIPFNSELEKQRNISGSDQMSNLRSGLRTELSNINLAKRAIATKNTIEQKKQNELSELTGFTNEMSKFLKSKHPEQYKEALNKIYDPKHLNEEDKNKLYSLLSKGDTSGINELLMAKQLSEDETYGDLLNNLLSGETFAQDFELAQKRGTISQGTPQKELSFGEKFWDVFTNPDEAINAWGRSGYGHGSFSQNMWGSDHPTMTSNAWQNIAKTDLNVAKGLREKNFNRGTDFTVSGILNRFNPLKVIDNATFGYQNDGITGIRDSLLNDTERAVEIAAFMTPASALGAAELFAGSAKGLGTAYKAFKTAQGLNKLRAAGNLAMPAFGYGITGINNIVNKVPIIGKPLVRYNLNKLHYGLYPWLAEGLTKELPELVENVGEGEYVDALGNAGNLLLQGAFLKGRLANTPEFFKYTTPSGRSISLGNANLPNITTAENAQQFVNLMKGSNASQLKNLYSTEADIINAEKALASGEALPRYTFTHPAKTQLQLEKAYQNLGPKEFMLNNLGFKIIKDQPIQFGTFSQPMKYPTRFGEFTFGPKRFYPAKLEGIDFKTSPVYDKGSMNLLGFKNGGVSMKLSKKEIDQYIKDGYIVEDE